MQVSNIPVDELKPFTKNPKKHPEKQIKFLQKSFKEFGWTAPILIAQDNMIVAGHGRWEAAKQAGFTEVPVIKLDMPYEKAVAYVVADNHLAELAETDTEQLAELLQEISQIEDFDIEATGFEMDDIDDMINELHPKEIIEDDVPDVPEDAVTQRGDVWELGRHRLMCGDSTDTTDADRLTDYMKMEISFTSPPYNAGKTPTEDKMCKNSKYKNDTDDKTEAEYLSFLIGFTKNALKHSEYCFVNIQSLAGNKTALIDYLYTLKSFYADTIIWQKQHAQPAMAENVLNSQFEYIHCFSHKATRAIGTQRFRGTLSNILEMSKQNTNKVSDHNATFPVEFAAFFVQNFCENTVLDMFLGSGTTLIAAEQLNRTCYGMEIDPHYCDVIIQRYVNLTGNTELTRNGEPYTWQPPEK